MAATLLFGRDWRNQFSLTYTELERIARDAKTFEKVKGTGFEVAYDLVASTGVAHTIVVPTHDEESFERIRYGRHMHKVYMAFSGGPRP
jgi:hypothetical protein